MEKLAIYGAGGLGREISQLIEHVNAGQLRWDVIGFFDDHKPTGEKVDGLPVLGSMDALNRIHEPLALVVAIANPRLRYSIVRRIDNSNVFFPTLCHPSTALHPSRNEIGKGCIITAGCIFTTGIRLGDFVIVNLATTVGHDVELSDFTSVMPGVRLSGNVKVAEQSFIGTGASILQNLRIGKRSTIGAGAVVTKDFPDESVVVGIPAKMKSQSV